MVNAVVALFCEQAMHEEKPRRRKKGPLLRFAAAPRREVRWRACGAAKGLHTAVVTSMLRGSS